MLSYKIALKLIMCVFTAQARAKSTAPVWLAFGRRQKNQVTCPCAFRPRRLAQNAQLIKWDLVQVLVRRSCGDPDKVLSKRFLHYLVQVLVRRSCGDLGEILSCNGPCGKILLQSSKRSLHDLVQVPVRRSLSRISRCPFMTCTGPSEKILWRSCLNPPYGAWH